MEWFRNWHKALADCFGRVVAVYLMFQSLGLFASLKFIFLSLGTLVQVL